MKLYQRTLYLLPVLLLFLLGGCATVPMTPPEQDEAAKTFTVKKDKSSIYLYRNESLGGAVSMTVTLDGKVAGQTGPQTYFLWEVEPGDHEISSVSENTVSLKITTEPGKAYYVWQEVKMGMFMARSLLHKVDEKTGQNGVMECKRAVSKI